jgi:LPS export ABC transporter protein LptC
MNNGISIARKYFHTAALFMSCCFVCSCENDPKQVDDLTRAVTEVEEARNIESYLSQEGVMKAKLTAPLMYRILKKDSPYVEFPKALHVDFYNESAILETWLDSKYGKYFESLDKVYLRDSVIVVNIKGDTLRAPELWWDQKAKLFYTDSVAEYHGVGKHIFGGKGLVATQDMSEVTFKMPTGPVQVSKDGTLQ